VSQDDAGADAGVDAGAAAELHGADVGTELREVEEDIVTDVVPDHSKINRELVLQFAPPDPEALTPTNGQTDVYGITNLTIVGDTSFLGKLGVTDILREGIAGKAVTRQDIYQLVRACNEELIEGGYYLARFSVTPAQFDDFQGHLMLEFDAGRIGEVTFKNQEGLRWFSVPQLRKRLQGVVEGDPFHYPTLREGLYNLNAHPDLLVNTDLRVRKEDVEDRRLRYLDVDLAVEDSLPFHAVIDFDNYSTDSINNWGAGVTLQYLNLTRHDDVISVSMPVSLDFQSLRSFAGSYYFPYYKGNGGALTMYAGYSDLDAEDVVEGIDVRGQGWFGGLQVSYNLIDDEHHLLKTSVGMVHRYVEDTLVVSDVETVPRDVTLRPYSLAFSYTSKTRDRWGGRNFLTSQTTFNLGGTLGTSGEDELSTQRRNADETYVVERLQFSRIQPFGGRIDEEGNRRGQWIMFMKGAAQVTSGTLIPAEQMSLGGSSTVRGYRQREYLGDHAVYVNLEVRTPLLFGMLSKPFREHVGPEGIQEQLAEGKLPVDRLQFVAFVDAGYLIIEDPLPGEEDSQSLASVGLGMRLGLTSYSQLKLDWGFPLRETDESSNIGAGHLNIQLQF